MNAEAPYAGHRRDSGFTLVELIVALAILALLTSMLPGAFAVAQRAWDSIRRIDILDRDIAARAFIEQRLREALPIYVADARGAREPGFRGEARRVSFVAPSASGPAGGGLYRFELAAEADGRSDVLVLQQAQVVAADPAASRDARRVLGEGPGALRFRYFGRYADEPDRRWHDAWPDGERLPELVEIAEANDRAERGQPAFRTLVVPLKLRRPD